MQYAILLVFIIIIIIILQVRTAVQLSKEIIYGADLHESVQQNRKKHVSLLMFHGCI